MRKSILILAVVLLSSFQVAVISTIDLNVMKAAEGQMGVFLGKIPSGEASSYGFRQEDDMDLCMVGKPYRIIEFKKSFYDEAIAAEDKNYISIKNEWRVPVSVREVNRTMLTVKGNPGNYMVTGMGDTGFARELQVKSRGISDSDEYYLLRIPALSADFFVHEANNSFSEAEFIPLASAMKAIPSLSKSYTGTFNLGEVQQKVKEELGNHTNKEPVKKQPKKKQAKKK